MSLYEIKEEKINEVIKQLDQLNPGDRLGFLDDVIWKQSELFKEELSKKILENKQKSISPGTTVPCECGGENKYKGKVKKKFFL